MPDKRKPRPNHKNPDPSPISVGNITDSIAAIGHGAKVTVNKYDGLPPLSAEESARLLADYRARILEETCYVNLRGIPLPRGRDGRSLPLQVPLDKVYIRIQATTDKQHQAQEEAEERSLLDRPRAGSKSRPVPGDILSALHTLGEYFYRRGEVYEAAQRPEPIDPEEALKHHKRLVLLGAPGAGKSTLLRFLARRAAESSESFVPVLVSLRDYATALVGDSTLALSEFALRAAAAGNNKLRQALEDEITNGHVLWLVDALDEARGWSPYAARQAGGLPGWLILTSRPVGYVSTSLETLPHFEVLPLLPENIDEFLHNWFGLLAAQHMADEEWTTARVAWLKKQLDDRPGIRALMRSPLLLTFLVILAGEERLQDLPEQRSELYRRYIEELLDSWEAERRPRSGAEGRPLFTLGALQGERARQLALQGFYYLGWALHLAYYGGKPQQPPTRAALIVTLADYLRADGEKDALSLAEPILDFWQEAGLLETWHLGGSDCMAFRHLTFQEYAASWGLAKAWQHNQKQVRVFLRPRLHHYPWHEPILLLASILPNVNALIQFILDSGGRYETRLHRSVDLVAEIWDENPANKDKRLLRRVVQIFEKIICDRSQSAKKKVRVCTSLAKINDPIVIPALIDALRDSDWRVRDNAVRALEKSGGSSAVPALINALEEEDERVRQAAVQALGLIGDRNAIPALSNVLKDEVENVHYEATRALAEFGGPEAVNALLDALKHEAYNKHWMAREALVKIGGLVVVHALVRSLENEDKYVRAAVATALGEIGDPTAIQALSELAKKGEEDFVRWTTVEALGKLRYPSAVPALIEALRDETMYVRNVAARAVGEIDDTSAVPALIQALKDEDEDVAVRSGCAEALGKICGPAALPILNDVFRESNGGMRCRIVDVLKRIDSLTAIPVLIVALEDKDNEVRKRASEALGEIGNPDAVEALSELVRDEDRAVRETSARALGQIGDKAAVQALTTALKDQDDDSDLRETLARALGQIGDMAAVQALTTVLKDQDEVSDVRDAAATALGEIGGPTAVRALSEALKDGSIYVRLPAIKALMKIDSPDVTHVLIEALQDQGGEAVWQAAQALGEIGGPEAVHALIEALKIGVKNAFVRAEVAKALRKIGGLAATSAILGLLNDKDRDVRNEAVMALGEIGGPVAIRHLLEMLADEDNKVRGAAVWALGRFCDPATVPDLIEALRDDNMDVRADAAVALGQIGDPTAVPALIEALKDNDMDVRGQVASALGEIGDPASVPALTVALHDDYGYVNLGAALALGQIGDPTAVSALIEALKYNVSDMPRIAANMLRDIAEITESIPTALQIARALNRQEEWDHLEAVDNRLIVLGIEAEPFCDPLVPARPTSFWKRNL